MSDKRKILEEVARTSIELLLREPFYAHILACLNKQVVSSDSKVKTIATGIAHNSYMIYINPVFWKERSEEPGMSYGLLKHELLHIIFKHPLVKAAKKDPFLVSGTWLVHFALPPKTDQRATRSFAIRFL